MTTKFRLGVDIMLSRPVFGKKERLGLITNNAALTSGFIPSRKALMQEYNLVKLFSPEHGLDAAGADGHFMHNRTDALTGLPVVSLYGERLAPDQQNLEDIDCLLVDLPDIGSRFYTYLWTMTHALEACAQFNKPLFIADRPNPLSGDLSLAEGPMLDEQQAASFIGRWRMPVRHSCTLGELALYFNAVKKINCPLQVIPCEGWNRNSLHPDHCTSFVPPSPAISCFESALLYPGLCFLEATNISEGRGTALPFRIAGAPWMKPEKITERFNAMTQGAIAREVDFLPEAGKYAGQSCKGIMLHVSDPYFFRPVKSGLMLLKLIIDAHPQDFAWAAYPTHVNRSGSNHLQLLTGQKQAETLFDLPMQDFKEKLETFISAGQWVADVNPYLLYAVH